MGYIILTGVAEGEDGQFVSCCRELGAASCGDTISEALDNLSDALDNLGEAIELNIEGLEESANWSGCCESATSKLTGIPQDRMG